MQPAGQVVTWDEFKTKFRKAHVPAGLIKRMKEEFRKLKQGALSVVSTATSLSLCLGMLLRTPTVKTRRRSVSWMDCMMRCSVC
jgi:Retrotransposon gag protein.